MPKKPTFLPVLEGRLAVWHRPPLRRVPAVGGDGCTWVVSVLGPQEQPDAVRDAVTTAGLGWAWTELASGEVPRGRAAGRLWNQAAFVVWVLRKGEGVLVHCSAGMHRTGMVAYTVLRLAGLERAQALAMIRRLRPATLNGLLQHGGSRLVDPDPRAIDPPPGGMAPGWAYLAECRGL